MNMQQRTSGGKEVIYNILVEASTKAKKLERTDIFSEKDLKGGLHINQ
jgi:hypothetical protein